MIFKGYFSWGSWLRLAILIAIFLYFHFMGVEHIAMFIAIPFLYLLRIYTTLRAKIILTDDSVEISQFENRHNISFSSIRRIEKFENGWFKQKVLGMASVGLTIFYDRVSDAIFYPAKAEELENELRRRISLL